LQRVPYGQFFDRVDAHPKALPAADVATFIDRNKAALQEFWAHSKTDALALKKLLEERAFEKATARRWRDALSLS
jgi:hypothetical protein